MKKHNYTIKILMSNAIDKRLLVEYLLDLGYIVDENYSEEWSKLDMIITDEFYAHQFDRNLLSLKKQPNVIFLPMVLVLPDVGDSQKWIDAGYDDVLKIPTPKAQLSSRLQTLFNIRRQAEYNFQFLMNNMQVGVYSMNITKRILTANHSFLNLLNFKTFDDIQSRSFKEMGISFQYEREHILKSLNANGKNVAGYESYWKLKNGNKILIRESLSVMKFDDDNENTNYIGTIEKLAVTKVPNAESTFYLTGKIRHD